MRSFWSPSPGTHALPCRRFANKFPWLSCAPFGVPVVPEVYRMSAMLSRVTVSLETISCPSPPIAELMSVSHGTELGAGAELVACFQKRGQRNFQRQLLHARHGGDHIDGDDGF